jgi:methionyl-tRNA synthetase
MEAVLMVLLRVVRDLAIALRPVVPTAIDKLFDQMGIAEDARDFAALENRGWLADLASAGFTLQQPSGVFPRLELPADENA